MSNTGKPTDKILAYDAEGRPIFGYNENGIPICYSKLQNKPGSRCHSIARMKNGRCKIHGGVHKPGPGHHRFRTGEYAASWAQGDRAQQLLDAVKDPDYLSLRQELGLNTLQISEYLSEFDKGTDDATWKVAQAKAEKLEEMVDSEAFTNALKAMVMMDKNLEKFGPTFDSLLKTLKSGGDRHKLWNQINGAMDLRRKLVETETKRNLLEQNHMKAEEVLFLFSQIVGLVKKIFREDTANLMQFALQLDTLSALMPRTNQNYALAGGTSPSSVMNPRSKLADAVRNQVESEEAEYVELEEEE